MKLEVGKKYVCKDMPNIKYVRINAIIEDFNNTNAAAVTIFYKNGHIIDDWYSKEGKYFDCSSGLDLVAEYQDTQEADLRLGPEHVGKKVLHRDGSVSLVISYRKNFVYPIQTHFNSCTENGFVGVGFSDGDIIKILD